MNPAIPMSAFLLVIDIQCGMSYMKAHNLIHRMIFIFRNMSCAGWKMICTGIQDNALSLNTRQLSCDTFLKISYLKLKSDYGRRFCNLQLKHIKYPDGMNDVLLPYPQHHLCNNHLTSLQIKNASLILIRLRFPQSFSDLSKIRRNTIHSGLILRNHLIGCPLPFKSFLRKMRNQLCKISLDGLIRLMKYPFCPSSDHYKFPLVIQVAIHRAYLYCCHISGIQKWWKTEYLNIFHLSISGFCINALRMKLGRSA
ncbi:MAG: hypothetical protein ACD_2C00098G0003 [uncultured bacterium (gcode 4)]|uniref:Uncharacterized protein n=1 Tax=uncultured bacterium (gcode 4) TaxID=1234023 RepID=K2GH71_9BACT|nr:MAG: hypothetical protein ACD_2C00098G0003 [uncultured bacterium (gcode 4)]